MDKNRYLDVMNMSLCVFVPALTLLAGSRLHAQTVDRESYRSIVEAFQQQAKQHPSVFPLEARDGGQQSYIDGLRFAYFGYGERRYSSRTDFHPAMDLAYEPLEVGNVTDESRTRIEVRAPQTYLKKVYAIQRGKLVSIARKTSGYKIVLRHKLNRPYRDNEGRPYNEFFTCYRHLDSRSLAFLTRVAKQSTAKKDATYQDLVGTHVFEAGDQIALVGFNPKIKSETPRVHLDYSLNLFRDPDKGSSIRRFAFDPLLLFPQFTYGDPRSHQMEKHDAPAYQITVDHTQTSPLTLKSDGRFQVKITAGGVTPNGKFLATRYFALNAMTIIIHNDGKQLAKAHIDRQLKSGYDTSSFERLDVPNESIPHFDPLLGEQEDIFRMNAFLPTSWLRELKYDWTKPGKLSITVGSIWAVYDGHRHSFEIPLEVSRQ